MAITTDAAPETIRSRDEKTNAIIKAARETFLARGYDAASMDQIALTAGVSKRTVYNRFRSKDELFGAAIEETCRALLPLNTDEIEATLAPRDFVFALARQCVAGLLAPEALSLRRIAAFEAGRNPAIGRNYLEHGPKYLVDYTAPLLERIAERSGLRIDDTREAIWRLGALITEPLHTEALMGAIPDDLDAAIDRQVAAGVDAFFRIYGEVAQNAAIQRGRARRWNIRLSS